MKDKAKQEKKIYELQLQISRVVLEKDKAVEDANARGKAQSTLVWTQSQARFSRVSVVNNCVTFRLGWTQAMIDPPLCLVANSNAFNA